MSENRMTPPTEGQEKDVLLVLDKQQGKVSAVKGFDKEGNLQTVPPIQGGEFMQVDKNGDIISNLVANFYRKFQDTEGLALFRCKASEVEQNAKAIEDNHRNPTPEGDRQTEALRVPKPDNPESKQGYRFDPAKIDWESLKKVGITAETLKNTKDFDRVMRGYKSRNTYTVSGSIGGFYLKPTDVKLSFYQAKDGTVVPKLHGVQQDEKLLQRPYNGHEFSKQEQTTLQSTGNLGNIAQIKDPKSGEQIPVFISRDRYTHELEYMRADKWKCPDAVCGVKVSPEQKAAFEAGKAVKMENLQFKDGTKRSAYLQVSAVERGLEFLPRSAVQALQQGQQPTQRQVAGIKDGQGVEFNGHVQPGAQGKFPDKVQAKDVTPAAESWTQVAVNTEGKTNEATKQAKEPLKQGQDKPTAKQKEKQEKTQDKNLKADKPKKSKGMKM
jgi:hypothetical protein